MLNIWLLVFIVLKGNGFFHRKDRKMSQIETYDLTFIHGFPGISQYVFVALIFFLDLIFSEEKYSVEATLNY